MKIIQLNIKEVLENKNITRYELSKKTEIKFQTINRYYNNQVSRYDKFILLKICLALECDISDLLKIKDL